MEYLLYLVDVYLWCYLNTLGQFFGAGKIAGKAFMFKTDPLESQIEKIVKMAISA